MRILHLSDGGLPDWRIEKSAISSLKLGNEVMFAGTDSGTYKTNTFSDIFKLQWHPRARLGFPFYWHSVRKQIEQVIRKARPDIIHAHNIFSARMASEFDIPFVYDDHEFWPVYVKRQAETIDNSYDNVHLSGGAPRKMARKIARRLLYNRAKKMWTKWEQEIVSQHPTITVSNSIADEIRRIGNNNNKVFVVPNYPLVKEVGDLKDPFQHETLSSVYAGTEAQIGIKLAHRNMEGLIETFTNNEIGNLTIIGVTGASLPKVKFTGYLSRQSMYNEMSNHSIGLVPFKKHWSHVYINPNKAYEYAHAGLFVLCTSSFKPVTDTLEGNCSTFEDYSDLVEKMEYYKNNIDEIYSKRIRIFEFAKSNLIWEKTEFNIFEAYRVC